MDQEKILTQIATILTHEQLMLATAESCTGGGLSFRLTSVPGSSVWFDRGFVCYSNEAKCAMLGVNPLTLESFGAVSESTVREMAEGALEHSTADFSIAITGIAGPGGGSAANPVGTVWMAIAQRDFATQVHLLQLSGNRTEIRDKTIKIALEKLVELLPTKAEKTPTI
ncbi:MAG: CinA family protein [Gammaproteobacteria bacterium]|nr:CinA family protein [Gammaproteobacteria bacterium]